MSRPTTTEYLVCKTPAEVRARLDALLGRRTQALRGVPASAPKTPIPAPPSAPPSREPRFIDPRPGASALRRRRAPDPTRSVELTTLQQRRDLIRDPVAAPADDPEATLARIQARMASLRATEPRGPVPKGVPRSLRGRLRDLGEGRGAPTPPPQLDRLTTLLPGTVESTPAGQCYLLRQGYEADAIHGDRRLGDLVDQVHRWTALLAQDARFEGFDPREAVFFDLETTGLSVGMGTLPFLIGAMHWRHDQWVLEQWLLRTPDEEPGALHALAARLAEARWAVSFNGRTYDAPLLAARYQAVGQPNPFDDLRGHLDLLPISRRLLREGLPNCKLGTIEAGLLGLRRVGDVPGSAVPVRYRDWLAGGDAAPLVDVVRHNRDDILSMVTLLDLLLVRAGSAPSLVLRTPKAALRLAKAAERLCPDHAHAIYTVAAELPETRARGRAGLRRLTKRANRAQIKE